MKLTDIDKYAWRGEPLPGGSNFIDRSYHANMMELYQLHNDGVISKEMCMQIKGELVETYNEAIGMTREDVEMLEQMKKARLEG